MTPALGLYRPRRTPLHLLPAWVKVIGLALGVVVAFRLDGPVPTAWAALVSLIALVSTLPPARATVRASLLFVAMAGLAGAFHWISGNPARGVEISLMILAIMFAALAINSSTSTASMLAVISWLARPLRRWVPTEVLGLMFSLVIRSIPESARILAESRAAARARGLGRSPRATLLPTSVRIVGYALQVGDAITARGLADFAPHGASAR